MDISTPGVERNIYIFFYHQMLQIYALSVMLVLVLSTQMTSKFQQIKIVERKRENQYMLVF